MRRGHRGNVLGEGLRKKSLRHDGQPLSGYLNIITAFLLAEQLRLNLNRIWDHCNHLVTRRGNASQLWYLNIKYMRSIENLTPFCENNAHPPKTRRR